MEKILQSLFSSEEEELYVLDWFSYLMMFMALVTYLALLFENVPYGRYSDRRFGFPVGVRVAWFIQELPALVVPLTLVLWTSAAKTNYLPNQLLLAMYFCHYIQR